MSEFYPFDQPLYNLNDQKYFCNLVIKYRYPITRVPELYRYIIEQNRCTTVEQEYADYLATQQL